MKLEVITLRKILMSSLLATSVAINSLTFTALAAEADSAPIHFEGVIGQSVSDWTVQGERLVYERFDDKRLFERDLQSGVDTELKGLGEPFGRFQLDGDWFGYEDGRSNERPFLLHNLKSGQSVQAVPTPLGYVQLANGKVVYDQQGDTIPNADGSGGIIKQALWVYTQADGSRKELLQLPRDAAFTNTVGFDGRFLIYIVPAGGDAKATVGLVNVETGLHTRQPLTDPGQVLGVKQGRALYVTHGSDDSFKLHLWDLATGSDRVIATGKGEVRGSLDGTRAAWIVRTESKTLHLFDFAAGSERTLPTDTDLNYVTLADRYAFGIYMGALLQGELPVGQAAPAMPKPEAKALYYTIASGDTLWRIAAKQRVSIGELARANNLLNPDTLRPGQVLYLPYPVSPRYEAYTVKAGDTLAKIAVMFRTDYGSIQSINKLSAINTQIGVGQLLYISRGPQSWSDAGGTYQTYAVHPGDTLGSIAWRAGTTVDAIVKLSRRAYIWRPQAGELLWIRKM